VSEYLFNVFIIDYLFYSDKLFVLIYLVILFYSIFTRSEIEVIRNITLWDVIINATDITFNVIQRRVFVWQDGDPCPQPFQLNSTMLEPCVPLQRYDYFEVINVQGTTFYF